MSFIRPVLGRALLASAFLLGTGNACARSFHVDQTAVRENHFSYSHLHHELRFEGRIERDFDQQLDQALAAHPHVNAVVIRSNGGYLESALRAAAALNAANLPVRASGVCASACAMLWSASHLRELDADARLGLHASHAAQGDLPSGLEALRANNAQAEQDDVLRDAGFAASVIAAALDTPPDQVLWLDAAALRHAGIAYQLMD